ncbi:hypothetical protein Tco_0371826 [Tanacetum coccineum]
MHLYMSNVAALGGEIHSQGGVLQFEAWRLSTCIPGRKAEFVVASEVDVVAREETLITSTGENEDIVMGIARNGGLYIMAQCVDEWVARTWADISCIYWTLCVGVVGGGGATKTVALGELVLYFVLEDSNSERRDGIVRKERSILICDVVSIRAAGDYGCSVYERETGMSGAVIGDAVRSHSKPIGSSMRDREFVEGGSLRIEVRQKERKRNRYSDGLVLSVVSVSGCGCTGLMTCVKAMRVGWRTRFNLFTVDSRVESAGGWRKSSISRSITEFGLLTFDAVAMLSLSWT